MTKFITSQVYSRAIGLARLGVYSLESWPIVWTRKFVDNRQNSPAVPEDHLQHLKHEVESMLRAEASALNREIYSHELLLPESPKQHLKRYGKIFLDNLFASKRASENRHKEFSSQSASLLQDVPEYYQRNFHNQTDGYLSEESADLYSHQTEILFKGTLGLMRRVLLAPLLLEIQGLPPGARILELGCGSGESSEIILKSCPGIQMTAVDLSRPYLQFAEKRLSDYSNVEWVQAAAEDLSADKMGSFDVVLSTFLFHEIPLEVRKKIIEVSSSLLKSGGLMCHIDSLQLDDKPQFNWALEQFPKDFHEPFYTNYVKTQLSSLLTKEFVLEEEKTAFLAKSILARKRHD